MKFFSTVVIVAAGSTLAGCVSSAAIQKNSQHTVISSYTEAYNDRDVAAMSALMHPDIQWLSVEGDQIVVVADGKADLVAQMTDYVASPSATTSLLGRSVVDGPFIAVQETASWLGADGSTAEQSALAVYEINDGLIVRVWYYPATQ